MLAKTNRVTSAADYKATVRHGRRRSTEFALIYLKTDRAQSPARFGFIVAKSVGNAVQRNLVRRRLKSIAAEALPAIPAGTDIVVRALPAASQASWATLKAQIVEALSKGVVRA